MKLSLCGFKAVDREVELSKLNLIWAPNGEGKSAIPDAIRTVVLGYLPELGKRLQDTARLISGQGFEITLVLDDGRVITRRIERQGKGYVGDVHASWVSGSRAEYEAAIWSLFGSDIDDVAETLDVATLFKLTSTERAARVEKMIGSGGAADDLPTRVARHTVARLLGRDVDTLPDALGQAIPMLPEGRAAILKELGATITSNLREHGIPNVIEWANEKKRDAEKTVKHRHAARVELESRLDGKATLAIEDLEAERARLREAVGAEQERLRASIERGKQRDSARSEHAQAVSNLTDAEVVLDKLQTSADGMIRALDGAVERFDNEIGVLKARAFGSPIDVDRIKSLRDQLTGIVDEPVEDLTRFEKIVEDLEAELTTAKANPWVDVREIGETIIGLVPQKALTGEKGVNARNFVGLGKRLIQLADTNLPSTRDLEAQLAAARETLTQRGELAADAAARNVENDARRTKFAHELHHLNTQADQAATSIEERTKERDKEVDLVVRKKAAALEEIRSQREKLQQQTTHVAQLREKVAALTSRVSALSMEPVGHDVPDPAELERIETAIKTTTERAGVQREIQSIIDEINLLDATVDVTRALEFALQRVRDEELRARGAGILDHINRFLGAAGRPEVAYIEAGQGICEIGWLRSDGDRVSVQTMSGSEYQLFAAALTAAILSRRGGELRLLLVEAGECDDKTLASLLQGIEAMEEITHAIVLTYHEPSSVGDAWNEIELGAEKVRAA